MVTGEKLINTRGIYSKNRSTLMRIVGTTVVFWSRWLEWGTKRTIKGVKSIINQTHAHMDARRLRTPGGESRKGEENKTGNVSTTAEAHSHARGVIKGVKHTDLSPERWRLHGARDAPAALGWCRKAQSPPTLPRRHREAPPQLVSSEYLGFFRPNGNWA